MHIIYSRIMLYRGVVWVYPVALRRICALFFFFSLHGYGFNILSSIALYPMDPFDVYILYALFPISSGTAKQNSEWPSKSEIHNSNS